jgi:hypothetical protein
MATLLLKDQITEIDLAGVTVFIVHRPDFVNTPLEDRWWDIRGIGPGKTIHVLRAETWEKAHDLRRQLQHVVVSLGVDAKVHIRTGSVTRRDAPDDPVR